MRRALELAEGGRGHVHPNPLVGAVVEKDGMILGEGYHARFGAPHAEIEAIRAAAQRDADVCHGATIHITLEPCAHHGKTPPCTDAIIQAGFRRVVFAMDDPNPLVAGKGRAALEAAGIEAERGVEEEAARRMNRAYLRFHATGLPFVTWKVATTLDGRAAFEPGGAPRRRPAAISSPEARAFTDTLRARLDAIVVGEATARTDDPGLRVRNRSGRDPFRVVLAPRLELSESLKLFRENDDRRTILVTCADGPADRIEVFSRLCRVMIVPAVNDSLDLESALRALALEGLLDLLVESGGRLGRALWKKNLLQRLLLLQSPILSGRAHHEEPLPALAGLPAARLIVESFERLGEDTASAFELPDAIQ